MCLSSNQVPPIPNMILSNLIVIRFLFPLPCSRVRTFLRQDLLFLIYFVCSFCVSRGFESPRHFTLAGLTECHKFSERFRPGSNPCETLKTANKSSSKNQDHSSRVKLDLLQNRGRILKPKTITGLTECQSRECCQTGFKSPRRTILQTKQFKNQDHSS